MMSKVFSKWTLLGVATLAGLVAGASLTYQLVDGKSADSSPSQRKIVHYRNPMGTGHISDKPMKDQMGMDYIPVYVDEAAKTSEPGTIVIDPTVIQNIGVRTVTLSKGNVAGEINANGMLALDERTLATITAKVGGYIEKLHVASVGQTIKKGQALFDLYSPDLIAALEEYLSAVRYQESLPLGANQTLHRNATDLVVAAHKRLQLLGLDNNQIKYVQAEGGVPRVMTLHAAQSGVVLKKNVVEGAFVPAGTELFTLANLAQLWVLADVYAADFAAVHIGQRATVQVQGLPGKKFSGIVDFVYPTLSAETRTAKIRIVIDNPKGLLRPDMYATVTIQSGARAAQLLVPKSAVLRTGKQDLVIMAIGAGRFRPQAIQLGTEAGENYTVLSGLKEGDTVVSSAQFLLDSESKIQQAVQQMNRAVN